MTGDPVEIETMCMGHLTDLEMANKIRMLTRGTVDHEGACVGARDRIMYLSQQLAIFKSTLKEMSHLMMMVRSLPGCQLDESGEALIARAAKLATRSDRA